MNTEDNFGDPRRRSFIDLSGNMISYLPSDMTIEKIDVLGSTSMRTETDIAIDQATYEVCGLVTDIAKKHGVHYDDIYPELVSKIVYNLSLSLSNMLYRDRKKVGTS